MATAMATIYLSSNFLLPVSSHKLWQWHPPDKQVRSFTVCTCSASNKSSSSRSSRKVKSNEELYNDIIGFLSAIGLPNSHVPTMKELSDHGRKDLANIVRRRGYKFIRQLLQSSKKTDLDEFVEVRSVAGQDGKATNGAEDVPFSVEMPSETESSELKCQNNDVNNIVEAMSLSPNVSFVDNHSSGSWTSTELNSNGYSLPPAESSSDSSCVEMVSPYTTFHHEKAENVTETFPSLAASDIENHSSSSNLNPSHSLDEPSYMSVESSGTRTLEDKVAKFIQIGDLDVMEDNAYELINKSDDSKSRTLGVEHLKHKFNGRIDSDMTLNETALTPKKIASSETVNRPPRDDCLGTGRQISDFDCSDFEARTKDSQIEIKNLKFILHQKEMELSQLKEQIEKEKLAMSVLQTRAETEINKARKLISDKDEELLAAEESLSGLEEVEIQYSGNGDIVEVTGSFNGWHHLIKMDHLPSSSSIESTGSRKSRLWSTVLWLYPGTYEIKFIVDGQWKIDPQRESVIHGGICNNILRVNR